MQNGACRQVDVECPFYRWDDGKRRVACEGPVEKSILTLTFATAGDQRIQVDTFCCGRYQNCEISRMLTELYED